MAPDPDEWFEMLWQEEEKKDPTHGGISEDRAREVFNQTWQEMDETFTSAQEKNREDRD